MKILRKWHNVKLFSLTEIWYVNCKKYRQLFKICFTVKECLSLLCHKPNYWQTDLADSFILEETKKWLQEIALFHFFSTISKPLTSIITFQEFYVIREWLLPGWLMVVQFFVTLALILSLTSQVLLACVIVRWPLRTVLRYEWIFVTAAFIMVAVSGKFSMVM